MTAGIHEEKQLISVWDRMTSKEFIHQVLPFRDLYTVITEFSLPPTCAKVDIQPSWHESRRITNRFVFGQWCAYGANIRTNRMILLSDNITDNLFEQ
jgi:hypothetical protein